MASTAKQLGQVAINTLATAYTVPALTTAILKSFDICNTTSRQIRVRVYLVPAVGAAGAGNALLYDYPIPANGIFGWEGEQVLAAGDTIQVSAETSGLTITLSGIEIA